jgi:hypothetical protein
MSLDDSDEKIALLKEIRDEVRRWSGDTHRGLDVLGGTFDRGLDRMDWGLDRIDRGLDKFDRGLDRFDRGLDRMDGQFDRIDAALADCAESVRLTVHYVKVLCKQRGIEVEPE